MNKMFVDAVGCGALESARIMCTGGVFGYTPNIPDCCAALAAACSNLNAKAADFALECLARHADYGLGASILRYEGATYVDREGYRPYGECVLLKAIKSARSESDPRLFDVAKALMAFGWTAATPLVLGGGESEHGGEMLSALAGRGLLDLAKSFEAANGQAMRPAKKNSKALLAALKEGQWPFASWLGEMGASAGSADVLSAAVEGLSEKGAGALGARHVPSWAERWSGLSWAAERAGLAECAAMPWLDGAGSPLASRKNLAIWMVEKAARSMACSASESDIARALAMRRRVAGELSSKGVEAAMSVKNGAPAPEPEGWFGRMMGFRAVGDQEFKKATEVCEAAFLQAKKMRSASPASQALLDNLKDGKLADAKARIKAWVERDGVEAAVVLLSWAKASLWDMPADGGVGCESRHPMRWGAFKMALAELGPKIDEPLAGLDGVNLLGLCCALGFEDGCAALLEAGASPDPDPLLDGPSPLSMAVRMGGAPIAMALLKAGASPLEGAKDGPFGYRRKAWAIDAALDSGMLEVVDSMLAIDARCAKLLDPQGVALHQKARSMAAAAGSGADPMLSALADQAERCALSATPSAAGARMAR